MLDSNQPELPALNPQQDSGLFKPFSVSNLAPLDLAAFWSRVAVSTEFQCWPWEGQTRDERGYGRFRGEQAHRVAYELIKGPIPPGLIVRHRCDNPPCCNPTHLEVGTAADNAADAVERGRNAAGERHGNRKLTLEQIDLIRRNPEGLKQIDLAIRFGVAKSTISIIRSGKRWANR